MNSIDQNILQRAINDLAAIRQAVDRTEGGKYSVHLRSVTVRANILIQASGLFCALMLTLMELLTGNISAQSLIQSAGDAAFKRMGILNMSMMLVVLAFLFYFIVWRASKRSSMSFNEYVADNFIYMRRLSFMSDLTIKFVATALIIMADKPQWVGPLFLLFIADYLIQGRYFVLPTNIGNYLGVLFLIGAIVAYATGSALLIWPLAGVCLVSTISLIWLIKQQKSYSTQKEQ